MVFGIFLAIIVLLIVGAYLIGYFSSSGSLTLTPDANVVGKALVVYDPGLSGGTKTAAFHMANVLKSKGYEVTVAGVRSSDAGNLSGYDILIVGSPTYGAKPTRTIESYLNSLKNSENITIGVYSLAGGDAQDSNLVMAQILKNKSLQVKVSMKFGKSAFGASADQNQYSSFVSQLLGEK
jgi:flavodoxin